jgi:hypothetical protein
MESGDCDGGRRRKAAAARWGARERIWGNRLCLEGWFREVRDLRGLSENESCAREGGRADKIKFREIFISRSVLGNQRTASPVPWDRRARY